MPLLLLAIPIVSTLTGGALALRFRRHISILSAIGAGILLGAAFLDLLPEAVAIGAAAGLSVSSITGITLLSFLLFHMLEHLVDNLQQRGLRNAHGQSGMRHVGAGMLIFHSFRDGMAIGAAYAASHDAGFSVALGIAVHDLGDGMNTVILTTSDESHAWTSYLFLAADALAPFFGGLITFWWALSKTGSVVLLAMAAGFFLQMATGEFLPKISRQTGTSWMLLIAVPLGAAIIYAANLLLGGRW